MTERMGWIPVEKPIPPLGQLLLATGFGDREKFEKIIKESRNFEKPYIAHELVRKERGYEVVGQLIDGKTGLSIPLIGIEGHFVGLGLPPEEIVRREAAFGRTMLDSISRMRHYSDLVREVEKTLRGERFFPEILEELNGAWGAVLARMRALRFQNQKALQEHDSFRERTYNLIKGVPQMEYVLNSDSFRQKYFLPSIRKVNNTPPIKVDLTNKEKVGYEALVGAGRLTMPILRVILGKIR